MALSTANTAASRPFGLCTNERHQRRRQRAAAAARGPMPTTCGGSSTSPASTAVDERRAARVSAAEWTCTRRPSRAQPAQHAVAAEGVLGEEIHDEHAVDVRRAVLRRDQPRRHRLDHTERQPGDDGARRAGEPADRGGDERHQPDGEPGIPAHQRDRHGDGADEARQQPAEHERPGGDRPGADPEQPQRGRVDRARPHRPARRPCSGTAPRRAARLSAVVTHTIHDWWVSRAPNRPNVPLTNGGARSGSSSHTISATPRSIDGHTERADDHGERAHPLTHRGDGQPLLGERHGADRRPRPAGRARPCSSRDSPRRRPPSHRSSRTRPGRSCTPG